MADFIMKMPDVGEGVVEAEVTDWMVAVGDTVAEDQHVADILTDKATVEITAPVAGVVKQLAVTEGEVVAVGAMLIVIETTSDTTENTETRSSDSAIPDSRSSAIEDRHNGGLDSGKVLASPAVRRRARAAGIDLAAVSSASGRVSHEDLDAYLRKVPSTPAPVTGGERISGLRRAIARKMEQAAQTIPHFNYSEEIDITALEALRESQGGGQQKYSYLPFFIRALVMLLPRYPNFNAHFDSASDSILRFDEVHVGIATHTDQGLKVPVLKNAQDRDLQQINAEFLRVTGDAREHRSRSEDLTGSTISISSLGKLGGIAATPIINYPEVAILVFHKAELRPIVIDGDIVVRRMMNISGAFDHRVLDGYNAAEMIAGLRQLLENPQALL